MHIDRTYALRIALVALVIALAAAAPAGAATKPFSLVISPPPPSVVAGGATTTITATLHDESTAQQVGSANLSAPSTFHVTSASVVPPSLGSATLSPSCASGACVVQLRNLSLPPGQSATVTMTVKTPACVKPLSSFTWSIVAKQANNFNGTGNNLNLDPATSSVLTTLDGACKLAFGTQPHNVVVGQAITGTDYTPTGSPVTVQVLDSGNHVVSGSNASVSMTLAANPGAATLGGTTPVSAVSGVATFSNLTVNQPAVGYTLGASSGTLTPATSTPFTAQTTATTNCPTTTTCTSTAGNANGDAQVVASPGAGTLTESVNTNNGAQLNCTGYTSADPNTYSFLTTTNVHKKITITIDKPSTPLTGTIAAYLAAQQICFGATADFTVNGGGLAPPGTLPDGTAGFIGLLPNCPAAGPCHARSSDKAIPDPSSPIGYDIVLVAEVPQTFTGDPHTR